MFAAGTGGGSEDHTRILHLITRLVAGGAQRNTLLCAENQSRRGHDVLVVSGTETGSEGSLLEEARQGSYRFYELAALVREVDPRRDLLALRKLVALLRVQNVDILHTHTSKAGLIGRVAGKICGVPVLIHTPHGHVFHSYFGAWKTRIFKACEQILARLATDALVMLSAGELRDHLAENIAAQAKLHIIPSGVSLAGFADVPRPPVAGDPVIGYVGRLADIKGPLDLIEAMPAVLAAMPNCRLLVVGDGPLRSQVEQQIEALELRGSVELAGWHGETRPFLARMHLLAVPSHNEGMGRVVVESMAAGIPVVASAVGGLVDLIQHDRTGLLCPARNPPALAEALIRMLTLPDRGASLGLAGQKRAHEFSDQVMFDKLEWLYAEMVRTKKLAL